ncbi:hypothetical protein D3C72_336310 [compost metagenome]
MRMIGFVIHMIQHYVFDSHATLISIGLFKITTHSGQEGFDIVLFVDRYNFVTDFVVWCMERNGQGYVNHIAQFIQSGYNARSRERYTAFGQTKTEVIQHDFHRWNDVSQVQQRLTHAHHHHVGDWTRAGDFCRANDFRRAPYLTNNFRHTQVSVEALLRC